MAAPARRFLIWGGGGHGKVVADLVRACGHTVVGLIDADEGKLGRVVEPGGARVVVTQEEFLAGIGAGRLAHDAHAVALGIGDNERRWRARVSLPATFLPALVHPSAVVSPSVALGAGSVVCARAAINAAARVGAGAIVNTGAIVEHDCLVGDGVHVSPGAILAGGVSVGERSWIGAGATVIEMVSIGEHAIVGAGAVVIRDVPGHVTVAGVPARAIR